MQLDLVQLAPPSPFSAGSPRGGREHGVTMMKVFRAKAILRDRSAEVRLSPSEAKILKVLTRVGEAYGVQIANELVHDVQLATVYVLLERMATKGLLTSRIEEGTTAGRRVVRRLYQVASTVRLELGGMNETNSKTAPAVSATASVSAT